MPLPVKFNRIMTLKSGMPKPIIKKAKVDEPICVHIPYSPMIMDDSIFSDTFGKESAPSVPIKMYRAADNPEE